MKTQRSIQCWFDFASTYSYPTIMRIDKLLKQTNLTVKWKPFLLGVIFNKQGINDSPFNLHMEKGKYMWRDLERVCLKQQIPFKRPTTFPRNGLLAARITCFYDEEAWISDFIKLVFQSNFIFDQNIADTLIISDCLAKCGQNPNEVIAKATSEESKMKLRTQTEQADKQEIFGAPSFLINNELFWGDDRLEQAIEWAQTHQ